MPASLTFLITWIMSIPFFCSKNAIIVYVFRFAVMQPSFVRQQTNVLTRTPRAPRFLASCTKIADARPM
jgi:hypothetical protein